MLAPLYTLLHKDAKFTWGEDQQAAFKESKASLQSPNLLVHYDPNLPIVLHCDASPYGVGSVLSHIMRDGLEKTVTFASRTLAKAERNYAHLEREGLSVTVVFGVIYFHKYLYGRSFTSDR